MNALIAYLQNILAWCQNQLVALKTTVYGVYASGTLTFVANAEDAETIDVNGITFTFTETPVVDPAYVDIGATAALTAINFAAVLNANGDVNTLLRFEAWEDTVRVTSRLVGTAGNAYTLDDSSEGNIERSAATLEGGAQGISSAALITGSIDCSANPNYPAATSGQLYLVSVAGKIGGGSGPTVEAGDMLYCVNDNAGGTQAQVGTDWNILQTNLTAAQIAALIHGATTKATPVDADELGLADSAASFGLKSLTWANLKATLLTYFTTIFALLSPTVREITAATDTITQADNGKIIRANRATGQTLTVTGPISAGFNCMVIQEDAGQTTFAAGGGATLINRQTHTKIAGEGGVASLVCAVADTVYLAGDTAA